LKAPIGANRHNLAQTDTISGKRPLAGLTAVRPSSPPRALSCSLRTVWPNAPPGHAHRLRRASP